MICETCKFESVFADVLMKHKYREHGNGINFSYSCTIGECKKFI